MKVRDNADRLLSKIESDEKNEVKKLALGFNNQNSTLKRLESLITNNKSGDQNLNALKELKAAILGLDTKADFSGVEKLLANIQSTMGKRKDFTDKAIVKAIAGLEKKLLSTPKSVDRTDEVVKAIKAIKVSVPKMELPDAISVDNFPPQMVPQPVTNININPLRGFIHSTTQTVTTTLAAIPGYGVLNNRRSVQFYNNSSTVIVFIGGSDVTSSTGMPVPAKSYSPVIDAGERMVLYGVTSSSTADIRVIEISNDEIGG